MIAPIYDKLSEELPGVRFYKIDIDNEVRQGGSGWEECTEWWEWREEWREWRAWREGRHRSDR